MRLWIHSYIHRQGTRYFIFSSSLPIKVHHRTRVDARIGTRVGTLTRKCHPVQTHFPSRQQICFDGNNCRTFSFCALFLGVSFSWRISFICVIIDYGNNPIFGPCLLWQYRLRRELCKHSLEDYKRLPGLLIHHENLLLFEALRHFLASTAC